MASDDQGIRIVRTAYQRSVTTSPEVALTGGRSRI
jgi:hypothetical protein